MNSGAYVSELANAPGFASANEIISSVISFYIDGSDKFFPEESAIRKTLKGADSETLFWLFSSPMLRHFLSSAIVNNTKPNEFRSAIEGAERICRVLQEQQMFEGGTETLQSALYYPTQADQFENDTFSDLFREHIAFGVSIDEAEIIEPTDKDANTLREAVELLETIVPELSSSLLPHVGRIVLIDHADPQLRVGQIRTGMGQNVSTHAIPGTIFLSPSPLKNTMEAAEAILHEAAHKKLSDLVLTRDVFRAGYDLSEAKSVEAIWNRKLDWNDNFWTTDRAMFAFHVYVYLAYYYRRALECGQDKIGEDFAISRLIGALRRANYLGRALSGKLSKDLGEFGQKLVHWQKGLLETLAEDHELGVIDVQLYMDRFDRDTRSIQRILSEMEVDLDKGDWGTRAKYPDWPVRRTIIHLLHSDLVSLNRILFAIGEQDTPILPNYDGYNWSSVISHGSDINVVVDYFLMTRKFISMTLRNQSQRFLGGSIQTGRKRHMTDLVADLTEHAYRHVPDLENTLANLSHSKSW